MTAFKTTVNITPKFVDVKEVIATNAARLLKTQSSCINLISMFYCSQNSFALIVMTNYSSVNLIFFHLIFVVEAYECDAATMLMITEPPVKPQNSQINICIESNKDGIIVDSIMELTLTQSNSGLIYKAIDGSEPTSITKVRSTGTKKAAVTTRLVAAFFEDLGDAPSEINIAGLAVLKSGYEAKQLVRIENSDGRALGVNDDQSGEFAVTVDISKNKDAQSAATQEAKRVLATLFSAVMGSALVL